MMHKIKTQIEDWRSASASEIGSKAANLYSLAHSLKLNVPKYIVVPASERTLPQNILDYIKTHFPNTTTYAVRSSAIQEDGTSASFAGMYTTKLNAQFPDLETAFLQVKESASSAHIKAYRAKHNLTPNKDIAVIIQEMIPCDRAGVAFGKNPITNEPEHLINIVNGLGEQLVSGEVTANQYVIAQDKITNPVNQPDQATLSPKEIQTVSSCLIQLEKHFEKPQDIEFGFVKDQFYLFQSRPITTGKRKTVWDNSNIIESYPGITSPLTFSFIQVMYETVYRQLGQLMGISKNRINENNSVFKNTLGLIRGRVYYNLRSWYQMLAMLPGYSLNARYMETMMGVQERFDLDSLSMVMSKTKARWRLFLMAINMLILQLKLPKARRKFQADFHKTLSLFHSRNLPKLTLQELIQTYYDFQEAVLYKWKPPMVNDFFVMIWFGILKKKCEQLNCPNHPNLHNDLLCGNRNIISTEPVYQSLHISSVISESEPLSKLFKEASPQQILTELKQNQDYKETYDLIKAYLETFGNRCVGELKLENESYAERPEQFIEVLQAYVQQGISSSQLNNTIDIDLRVAAEKVIKEKLKGNFLKKWWFNVVLAKTRAHVTGRENLRFERTKAFGFVRMLFNQMGQKLSDQQLIKTPKDVFFLTLDSLLNSTTISFPTELMEEVSAAKLSYAEFKLEPPPANRITTYNDTEPLSHELHPPKVSDAHVSELKGIGCCPGTIRSRVQVVEDPTAISSVNGAILVARSTDPGWVKLFPTTCGLLVERGSLLSHSAIVSREMGIPCIVGIDHLLSTLVTGDEVIMDGSSGSVQILKKVKQV